MQINVVTWAMRQPLEGDEQVILLLLAMHAADERAAPVYQGNLIPISVRWRGSLADTHRVVAGLCARGFLTPISRGYRIECGVVPA